MTFVYEKRIICLASSRKISGRCVAGKEVTNDGIGDWIRPVSNRPNGEVSWEERRYEDGSDPALLDVIRITMRAPVPHPHQPENHLLHEDCYWIRLRLAAQHEVLASIDKVHG